MKNEKEFLQEMWLKVDSLEHEKLERDRVKELNRKLTIKSISIAASAIIFFLITASCPQSIADGIYPLTIGTLLITFTFEYLSINKWGDKIYGD